MADGIPGYEEWILLSADLRTIIVRMTADRLWGSFLLDVAHDVARSPEPNAPAHNNLRATIAHAQGAVAAIKDAAEDIFVGLHVDPGQFDDGQPSSSSRCCD